MNKKDLYYCFPADLPFSAHHFASRLKNAAACSSPVLFLCIGTDRSTGDCLGPLVGSMLKRDFSNVIPIYGTLKNPVHAENLSEALSDIHRRFPSHRIITVDAAVGIPEHLGQITISNLPFSPGLGVKKNLPCAGEISITGIIAEFCDDPVSILSSVRLSFIIDIADRIYSGIRTYCLEECLPHP